MWGATRRRRPIRVAIWSASSTIAVGAVAAVAGACMTVVAVVVTLNNAVGGTPRRVRVVAQAIQMTTLTMGTITSYAAGRTPIAYLTLMALALLNIHAMWSRLWQ